MFQLAPFSNTLFDSLQNVEPLNREIESYSETDDEINLAIEMPGFEKGKISILREGNALSVTATREVRHRMATTSRSYQRRFVLPKYADIEQIEAKYNDGILSISAKKLENLKPKKIEIK